MVNIFKRELKANLKSVLIWSAAMIAMAVIGFGEYGIVMAEGSNMDLGSVVDMMPRIVKVMFGMGTLPVTTPEGWYVCMFLWCAMIAYIHAALLGASIISKEERDRTAEFLFTRPIRRNAVISAKILAAALNTLIVVFAGWAATMAVFAPHVTGTDLFGGITLTMLGGMLITALVFLFIGLFLSTAFSGRGKAVRYAAFTVIAAYFISVIIEMSGNVDYLNFLTPFRYFDAARVLENGAGLPYILLSAGIAAVTGYFTYVLFGRRNLRN